MDKIFEEIFYNFTHPMDFLNPHDAEDREENESLLEAEREYWADVAISEEKFKREEE